MLIAFFNYQGLVHYKFVLGGQAMNQEFYLAIFQCLQQAMWKKHPEPWLASSLWYMAHFVWEWPTKKTGGLSATLQP